MRYTEEMAKIRCVLMIVWITMGEPAAAQMFTQSSRPYDESLARKLMAMSAGAYAVSPDECIWRLVITYSVEYSDHVLTDVFELYKNNIL